MKFWIDFLESRSDFSKKHRSNTIEKQGIINLIYCIHVSYPCVVHCDSEIAVLGVEDDASFCPFLY